MLFVAGPGCSKHRLFNDVVSQGFVKSSSAQTIKYALILLKKVPHIFRQK